MIQGRLAQLDRVQASEAWGRGFESHAAHHFFSQQLISFSHASPTKPFHLRISVHDLAVAAFHADFPATYAVAYTQFFRILKG